MPGTGEAERGERHGAGRAGAVSTANMAGAAGAVSTADDDETGADGEGVVGGDGGPGRDGALRRPGARRRRGRVIAVVVLLVLVLVAGGAGAGAEFYTRSRVAAVVRSALPGLSSDARITTEGLVLPQVLGGRLDSLAVTAGELELSSGDDAAAGRDGLTLLDLDATLTSISLSDPFPTRSVDATASVGWDRLTTMVAAAAPDMPALTVQAGALGSADDPGTATASTSVLGGLAASMTIAPSVSDDGGLLLSVTSITVRGIEFDPGATFLGRPVLSYVGLESSEISVGAGSLPQGLSLSRVSVTDKGLRLSLSGSDVEMADL